MISKTINGLLAVSRIKNKTANSDVRVSRYTRSKLRSGMSVLELLAVVVIMGILVLAVGNYIIGGADGATTSTGKANAKAMTEMCTGVLSLGGTVSASAASDVDVTSVTTLIADLVAGVTITLADGTTVTQFKLDSTPTAASYTYAAGAVTYNGSGAKP